jgi:serine/threonine-protein kinase
MYFNGLDSGASVKDAVDHAVALQPDSGEAWLAQAVYRYRVLRQFPSALDAYREAQTRLPNSADVLEEMAHVERRLGQKDAAERHYRAAVQLDPQNIDIQLTLAELLAVANRMQESNDLLDHALKLSPANEEALLQKVQNLQVEGRLAESAAILARIDPNSASTDVAIARTQQFILERRLEEAIALFKSGKPPVWAADPRTITTLGLTEKEAGHDAEAKESFERALAAMKGPGGQIPVDTRLLSSFAILDYAALGQKEAALSEAQHARTAYKEDAMAWLVVEVRVAMMDVLLGDHEAAVTTLAHLVEANPWPTRWYNLRLAPVWDPLRNDPRFQALLKNNVGETQPGSGRSPNGRGD